jgi:hypothetical protein
MKYLISERQYNIIINEACGDDTYSSANYVKPSRLSGLGNESSNNYPVFSCVKLEPITIMGKTIYPKNAPKDVGYSWEDVGEDGGKKYRKVIQLIFNKYKDPSGGRKFYPWIVVRAKVQMEGKKTVYSEISNITNTFKCGANFCIDIKFKNNDVSYKKSPNIVDDSFRGGGSLAACSDCDDVITFPNFGNYDSLKKFASDISKIEFNLNKLTT